MAEISPVAVSPSLGSRILPPPSLSNRDSLPNCPQLLMLQGLLQVALAAPSEWDRGTAAAQKDRQDGGGARNGGTPEPWDLVCLLRSLRVKKRQHN